MNATSQSFYWKFYRNGAYITSLNSNMGVGYLITNAENYAHSGDSAWSHFDGARYSDSLGWHNWSTAACFFDNSDAYDADWSSPHTPLDHFVLRTDANSHC